jgi:hypothetical protein
MIESKSMSHSGLPQKPNQSMSHEEILSGAAWFFIGKNGGRKPIPEFQKARDPEGEDDPGGKISPLDHIGPDDLRIKELLERVDQEKITEIIFALPADVEGESTTNYIVDLLKNKPVDLTRIARGIPAGGGLESADELTLSAALSGRTKL